VKNPSFVRESEPLAGHSTLGVGGHADFFARIKTEEQLFEAAEFARDEGLEIFVLGHGSNVIFSDEGFKGLVLKICLRKMRFTDDEFWVDAGAAVCNVAKLGGQLGFTGFEEFSGLPGTIGGAIFGNAGCFGAEFGPRVEAVRFFDGENVLTSKTKSFIFPFLYRHSVFKDHPEWIMISACLAFKPGDSSIIAEKNQEILARRRREQPKAKSAGCIFKNPLRDGERVSASKLIDNAGLKGKRVGNAEISPIHANFFVNLGGAKAGDFAELIKLAKGRVFEKFKIVFEEEIITVGEF
jgi:UDP-N-acetylmuramate dehydrogenase